MTQHSITFPKLQKGMISKAGSFSCGQQQAQLGESLALRSPPLQGQIKTHFPEARGATDTWLES